MALNHPPTTHFLGSPSPSFPSLPPPPNPSRNPSFCNPTGVNQRYPSPATTPPPPPDLPTTLSTLKHLINLSQTNLAAIPSPLLSSLANISPTLSPCPFDPHHRVPPESLFRHSLHCPSSPHHDLQLLDSLRYPHTLQSSRSQDCFTQTLDDPTADLCFSLDEYGDFGPSFFYRDCPGAVPSSNHESTSRTFTLPGILSVECANFSTGANDKVSKMESFVHEHNVRVLPSELWFVTTETEAWCDYPATYSYSVLRAIVGSLTVRECEFLRWVIANSPYYGIVIDVPMRNHIVLLFQLCFKAIVSEAVNQAKLLLLKDAEKLNQVTMSLNCPILVEVMKWLSFQLSVLYGEVNGKRFSMDMLKQWILKSATKLSLFLAGNDVSTDLDDVDREIEKPLKGSAKGEEKSSIEKSVNRKSIFVSQVAAAVAALHERALLEEKLKAVWDAKPLTSYQRAAEHAYLSKRADEERKRCSNYRPLHEHDVLTFQRPHEQEHTTKTREELIAEARDYKRRRMSYRGKKLKRNTTEVMRDIIENFMESIKEAGSIGCSRKDFNEAGKSSSEPHTQHVDTTDSDGLKKNMNFLTVSSDHSDGCKGQVPLHDDIGHARNGDEPFEDCKKRSRDSGCYHKHREDRGTVSRDRRGKEYYYGSLDREKSHGGGYRGKEDLSKMKVAHVLDFGDNFSRDSANYRSKRGNRESERMDGREEHLKRDHRADSATFHGIDDRYDPYESPGM